MMRARQWQVILPVRSFRTGKSRLRGAGVPDAEVTELAWWLAARTLGVLHETPEVASVLVVTDESPGMFARWQKATVLSEQRAAGLNTAVTRGLSHLRTQGQAGKGSSILVLHADLPMLTSEELSSTLLLFNRTRGAGCVVDQGGTGTTALSFCDGRMLQPSFGSGSASRHEHLGFQPLELPLHHGLRADLDTWEQYFAYFGKLPNALTERVQHSLYGQATLRLAVA